MGVRGRKSRAELSVVDGSVVRLPRQPPSPHLTPEQAAVWREIVDAEPADWFTKSTLPMLESLCCHVVARRNVSRLIEAHLSSESLDVAEYDRLLKMQERESRCIASLSVKLRISQSSTVDERTKKAPNPIRPHEI